MRASAGLELAYTFEESWGAFQPAVRGGWETELHDDPLTIEGRFASGAETFLLTNDFVPGEGLTFGLSMRAVAEKALISLDYDVRDRENVFRHDARISIRIPF